MLVELHVVDLGIVADLNLVLDAAPGMTAITGEAGAGKTLIVEAVELLVGGRADTALVRDGAAEARVEGRFVHPETGEDTVLARVLPRDGRSRAYVDGRLATVGELAVTGRALVDLHGQHAHQSLLDPAVQRGALDRYAGAPALDALARYREERAAARALDAELEALGGDARARAREIDLLRYQVDEITAARLDDPAEDVALEAEEALLADAVAHRAALAHAYEVLEGPASDALGDAVAALDGRTPFAGLAARLRGVQGELADVEQELRHEVERVDEDPERADIVRARRQQLHELGRKYGSTLADVITYGAEAAARLAELQRYEERAASIEARRAEHAAAAGAAAEALTVARRAAADPLARAIELHLRQLAMPHAAVEVVVEHGEPTDDGHDRVVYLLAPNPGETPRPLARAASGGELSRAMLATRVVLSEAPPTLVFDEVDAGIGGEAGVAVGRLLQTLGSRHQVLCVTHLAQVAAFAGTQVVGEKTGEQGGAGTTPAERTVASAATVDGEARVAELSRMLAGIGDSSHARRHAAELLDTATASGPAPPARRGRR